MGRLHPLVLVLLLPCSACWSVDRADLDFIGEEVGLVLTESSPDADAIESIASLHVARVGFYLLGFVPLVNVSLDQAIRELALEAAYVGADGVVRIRYQISSANPLKFLVFPIPDWTASIEVSGMAFRWRDASSEALTPGGTHSGEPLGRAGSSR